MRCLALVSEAWFFGRFFGRFLAGTTRLRAVARPQPPPWWRHRFGNVNLRSSSRTRHRRLQCAPLSRARVLMRAAAARRSGGVGAERHPPVGCRGELSRPWRRGAVAARARTPPGCQRRSAPRRGSSACYVSGTGAPAGGAAPVAGTDGVNTGEAFTSDNAFSSIELRGGPRRAGRGRRSRRAGGGRRVCLLMGRRRVRVGAPAARAGFASAGKVLANPDRSSVPGDELRGARARLFVCVCGRRSRGVCGVRACALPARAALEGSSTALAAGTACANAFKVFARPLAYCRRRAARGANASGSWSCKHVQGGGAAACVWSVRAAPGGDTGGLRRGARRQDGRREWCQGIHDLSLQVVASCVIRATAVLSGSAVLLLVKADGREQLMFMRAGKAGGAGSAACARCSQRWSARSAPRRPRPGRAT